MNLQNNYDEKKKQLEQRLKDIIAHYKKKLAVVANKSDLYESSQVSDEEGKAFAKSINGIFQSTSAKSNTGISTLFDNIGHRYFDPNFDTNEKETIEKKEYEKKKAEKEAQKTVQPQTQRRGVKLETNKAKQQKKKGCC